MSNRFFNLVNRGRRQLDESPNWFYEKKWTQKGIILNKKNYLECCIKLRLEDLDWKISYIQHNKLSTSKDYYLFLTFCNLEAWFLFTQSKIEDIALFGTDITEKMTSFITTRIPPFSESMNKKKSAFQQFMWSPCRCLYLHFKSAFLKPEFLWLYCIPGGWYVLICFICKPEHLHCILSIFLEPLFWLSANSSLLLLTKKADSKPILGPVRYIFYQHEYNSFLELQFLCMVYF